MCWVEIMLILEIPTPLNSRAHNLLGKANKSLNNFSKEMVPGFCSEVPQT